MTVKAARGVELCDGETVTLFASAARTVTAGTNGAAVDLGGERVFMNFLLNITNADTDIADTLDVYIDFSNDNATWVNAVHFEQVIGTDAAEKQYVTLQPYGGTATVTVVTSDAAVGVVRPEVWGRYVRGRYVIVDADADGTFTFSLIGYAV